MVDYTSHGRPELNKAQFRVLMTCMVGVATAKMSGGHLYVSSRTAMHLSVVSHSVKEGGEYIVKLQMSFNVASYLVIYQVSYITKLNVKYEILLLRSRKIIILIRDLNDSSS